MRRPLSTEEENTHSRLTALVLGIIAIETGLLIWITGLIRPLG